MRIPVLLLSLLLCLTTTYALRAQQDPGAQQDAEAAREKLLKASDQLDNIQANSESTKSAVDGMKTDVTKLQADVTQLQTENASLKQELADLQAAFDKAESAHAKERQVLIDSVADLIKQSGTSKPGSKKKAVTPVPAPDKTSNPDAVAPPATPTPSTTALAPPADIPPAAPDEVPPKPQKGYYHVVASGETLRLICNAYRQDGVNVTVGEVQKANGLTDKSVLQVGQKLFIPKPGT